MPTLAETLNSRWKDSFDTLGVPRALRPHMEACLGAYDRVQIKRNAIAADQTLSEIGRSQKLAAMARDEAKSIAKANRALAAAHGEIQKQKLALTPTVKDKKDLAAAALRQEVRARLREMGSLKATALLLAETDPLIIEAAAEAPLLLTGLTKEQRDQVLSRAIERQSGPALEMIADQEEAAALTQAAIRAATVPLAEAAGIQHGVVDKWLDDVAPADDAERAAESDRFNVTAVTEGAIALPLGERKTLIDKLLETNVAELNAA